MIRNCRIGDVVVTLRRDSVVEAKERASYDLPAFLAETEQGLQAYPPYPRSGLARAVAGIEAGRPARRWRRPPSSLRGM